MVSPVKIWRNQKNIANRVEQVGEIVVCTTIRVPPAGFAAQAPYKVCIVQLANGDKMTAQLVSGFETENLVGKRIRCVVRQVSESSSDGVIEYGIKVQITRKRGE